MGDHHDRCASMLMIDYVFYGLVVLSAAYWLAALVSVARYRWAPPSAPHHASPVTMLKPMQGDAAEPYENLLSSCLQDYQNYEIVFRVGHFHHPAPAAVDR